MTDRDDEWLRDVLRERDPASALPPLDPARVERRTEDVMNQHTTGGTDTGTDTGGRAPRGRRTAALAGAGVVAAAAVVVAVLAGTGSGGPVAPGTPPPPALVLTEAPTGGVAASCAVLTPEFLANRPIAFEATVLSVDGGRVTLGVSRVFRGGVPPRVVVDQQPGAADEFSAGSFAPGGTYLVSADAARTLSVCGATGPATPELREVYQRAFGR